MGSCMCVPTTGLMAEHPWIRGPSPMLHNGIQTGSCRQPDSPLPQETRLSPSLASPAEESFHVESMHATEAQDNSGPAVLFAARGGNIHGFTAVTDTAVLDLLTPPYDARAGGYVCDAPKTLHGSVCSCLLSRWCACVGRHCTYYVEVPSEMSGNSKERLAALQVSWPLGSLVILLLHCFLEGCMHVVRLGVHDVNSSCEFGC